ncbi:MAG: glycosyltransferase family 2 protein [Roseateles sp.]|uniref:glycosyltransferase family 2 protein n=1 Tax=Roseateles sp. TaxID=1971397 RepID=UPI0040361C5E
MPPLLSVVMPTHNRARYAMHAIESVLTQGDRRLELVVSDTSTDGELMRWVAQNPLGRDPRLKYFRPEQKLDMTGNHNAAIGASKGEFLCLIGDDDTIAGGLLEAAQWAHQKRVDLIAPNVVANYVWPDFRSRHFGARHASRLYFAKQMGGGKVSRASDSLALALREAAQGTDGLPKIYHGVVRRTLMERVRDRSGQYFHGSSPDVSGAVGLAVCSETFLVVDFPLSIPGASGGSNSGRSAMNTHKGKLSAESQTSSFVAAGWSPGVPKFFSVETVWAHAALETLKHLAPSTLIEFNFVRLLATCSLRHPEYGSEIAQATSEASEILGTPLLGLQAAVARERRMLRRARIRYILARAMRPTAAGGRPFVDGLATVAEAPPRLAARLVEMKLDWETAVRCLVV